MTIADFLAAITGMAALLLTAGAAVGVGACLLWLSEMQRAWRRTLANDAPRLMEVPPDEAQP